MNWCQWKLKFAKKLDVCKDLRYIWLLFLTLKVFKCVRSWISTSSHRLVIQCVCVHVYYFSLWDFFLRFTCTALKGDTGLYRQQPRGHTSPPILQIKPAPQSLPEGLGGCQGSLSRSWDCSCRCRQPRPRCGQEPWAALGLGPCLTFSQNCTLDLSTESILVFALIFG